MLRTIVPELHRSLNISYIHTYIHTYIGAVVENSPASFERLFWQVFFSAAKGI